MAALQVEPRLNSEVGSRFISRRDLVEIGSSTVPVGVNPVQRVCVESLDRLCETSWIDLQCSR